MESKLVLYNTLTRRKEVFEPLTPGRVGMYVCGPTVYGDPHLGHARPAVTFDLMFRYLKSCGYKVRYVRNITDVGHLEHDADEGEDKIAKKARLEQLEPMEVAHYYTERYHRAMDALNVETPSIEPYASGHIIEQIELMLDMGFIHDIRRILPLLPAKRQTLFFSATMPDDIVKLANTMLRNPAHVTVTPPASVVETIRQSVLFAEKAEKRTLLASLLRERPESSVLVFSRTKHGADRIARILTKAGIEGRAIHGDKSQGARERAMNDFRSGACRVLIATDIAARGIDISELPLVINYDLPEVPETYVHRIGRTGRAGRDGQAIAFCSEEERPLLKDILKLTGLELDPDSGELAPAQNSRKKPAGKKPDTAQTGGQKQAEEKRAAQKQPAQSQAGQRPGRRKPQGQAPGDPKPQGQRTGGKQTPDGQQPQDKDAAARPARRRNRNRGRQKPDRQNAAAANTERRQDDRKSGSQKPARDKRETGSPEAPRKTQAPEKKKSGMGSWLSGILRPGRK